ncbi:hypothetical protein KIH39_24805 [Telmatocola sphagniphila]|uniref:Uncharacterized protein n=1 Tax=Telmatocola sphagniphila TaxID=1123043 RepID=A0A8E6EV16_9BACT|nr:hypothetical protein [Telmatocola sphagniphila]QVL32017.1 hypothetical protein KIH39_24805 [Telmatocola sphagniphila]
MNDAILIRKLACRLLMFLVIGCMTARLFAVENVLEPSLIKRYDRNFPASNPLPSPTFSANDRARWATVRALVDRGTFVIGERIEDSGSPTGYRDEGILFEESYRSIDVVMNPETQKFYGTKPPLLTVIVAGEYWLLKKITGWDIDRDRWPVVCTILLTLNILPFAIYLFLIERLLDSMPVSEGAKLFTFAACCFGTFLTTFSNTLNNHTPASFCILFALYPWLKSRSAGESLSAGAVLISGLLTGFAASLDLPAAAFAGLLGLLVLRQSFGRAFLFAVGVIIPLVIQAIINYWAISEWQPIYAKFGGPWYEFAGSHWLKLKQTPRPPGIDFADEPKTLYAFHLLVGHHGWFSLTPVFLLALLGLIKPPARFENPNSALTWNQFRILTAVVASVVFTFYILRTNNYGGFTSGPRWLFWMTPLFLLHLPAAWTLVERSATGRFLAEMALAISVFSTSFPIMNPWRHPWLLQLGEYWHWFRY